MNTWLKSLLSGLAVSVIVFLICQNFIWRDEKRLFTLNYIMEMIPDQELAMQSNEDILETVNKVPVIIKRRCEAAGYHAFIKITANNRKLDINIQHVDDTLYANYIITRKNKLEFREMYSTFEIPSFPALCNDAAKKYFPLPPPKNLSAKGTYDSTKPPRISEVFDSMQGMVQPGLDSIITFSNSYSSTPGDRSLHPEIGSINEKDTAFLNKILQSQELIQSLPADIRFYYGPASDPSRRKGVKIFYLYAIRTKGDKIARLQNRDIERANLDYDMSGRPEINFRFNAAGVRKWAQMTRVNIGRNLPIILDDLVITAPRVNDAIEGGNSSISGGFTVEEASILAIQLNSGIVPADLKIVSQNVSPEGSGNKGKLLLITITAFVVASGLAWFVFNTLKNS